MRSLRLLPCIVSIALAARWEQNSDYLDSGPDRIPPCGSNGNFVGLSLDPVQYEEDKAIIFKLLEVSSPEQLGVLSQKKNSDIITPGYKGINIMNIFRISTADRLEAYEELLKNESTSDNSFVISTAAPNDEATKLWRSQHNRSEREHLLLHGTRWDSVKKIICQGFGPPRKTGAFGRGLYFADQIEKSDQYSPDVADDANWVVVVRANMARTVQVQREIPCTKDSAERKKHQIFHWADPVGGHKDEITWQNREDNSGNFTDGPPYNWSSIQVIATAQDPEFSRKWAKTCEYTNLSNTLPWRFNEYVLRYDDAPRVVVEYVVRYERVQAT